MIKFFRKIRERYLSEGKFNKYLLYALGEIVLVVIGILIAVSINNWNESRKNTVLERQLLISFQKDVVSNQEELQRVIAKSGQTPISCDSLLDISQGRLDPIAHERLLGLIMSGTGYTIYTTHEGTILDIIGSGKLDLVQNDSIRLAIASWHANLKHLREWEMIGKDAADEYMKYLIANLDMYKDIPDSILTFENKKRIFSDRRFLNLVVNRIRVPSILNAYYRKEIPKLERLLAHLDQALEIQH